MSDFSSEALQQVKKTVEQYLQRTEGKKSTWNSMAPILKKVFQQ